jgi:tetratricopeptide (TPR) repeat protein
MRPSEARISLRAALTLVLMVLLTGCRTTRQSVAPEETFFTPLTALPKTVEGKPQTTVPAPRPQTNGKADSLLNSARDQDRRIGALAVQLGQLEASRRGTRTDSAKSVPRTTVPTVAPKTAPAAIAHESLIEAEKLFASGEYRKTIQWCQNAFERGSSKGIEDKCYFLKGASHYRLKQLDPALVSLKKVLDFKASTKRADASFLMGLTYRQLGMRERAGTMFTAALKESPDDDLARSIRQELDRLAKNR